MILWFRFRSGRVHPTRPWITQPRNDVVPGGVAPQKYWCCTPAPKLPQSDQGHPRPPDREVLDLPVEDAAMRPAPPSGRRWSSYPSLMARQLCGVESEGLAVGVALDVDWPGSFGPLR